jgi:hypothetical protein
MKDFSPQMTPSLGILFFAKKTKSLQNGQLPVYLRITVNGERVEVALYALLNIYSFECQLSLTFV